MNSKLISQLFNDIFIILLENEISTFVDELSYNGDTVSSGDVIS